MEDCKEKLTKEQIDSFLKEKDHIDYLLNKRGNEIIKIAKQHDFDLGVGSCDNVCIYNDIFYISEDYCCMGESGTDYSIDIPIGALYSDMELNVFIDKKSYEKAKLEEHRKKLEEEKEREQYEKLKAKFENK